LIFLFVAILAAGCAGKEDPTFARQVIDAVYAGSLDSIKDSLTPEMQAVSSEPIATQGTTLSKQFGAVTDVSFKSRQAVPEQADYTMTFWTITAERGSFEMKLVMDENGKLAGLWF